MQFNSPAVLRLEKSRRDCLPVENEVLQFCGSAVLLFCSFAVLQFCSLQFCS
jgi:hypothetical protein